MVKHLIILEGITYLNLLFFNLISNIFLPIKIFSKNFFTVSTSGSSGMNEKLKIKLKKLDKNNKEKVVSQIFSDVSNGYDLMNDIMTFGLHRIWKDQLIDLLNPKKHNIILDLATGSGDLIQKIKKKFDCICLVYDTNFQMLEQAQRKKIGNYFLCGRSEEMPFKDNTFDFVVVSFGLRNFSDQQRSLKEINRILKKGGKFLCLEFSQVNSTFLKKIFFFYKKIIPIYGKYFLNNEFAYKYLIESIELFPNQIKLTKKLLVTGFCDIEVYDILDGLASIHLARK